MEVASANKRVIFSELEMSALFGFNLLIKSWEQYKSESIIKWA